MGKKNKCLVVPTLLASLGAERWAFLLTCPFLTSWPNSESWLGIFKEKPHSLLAKAYQGQSCKTQTSNHFTPQGLSVELQKSQAGILRWRIASHSVAVRRKPLGARMLHSHFCKVEHRCHGNFNEESVLKGALVELALLVVVEMSCWITCSGPNCGASVAILSPKPDLSLETVVQTSNFNLTLTQTGVDHVTTEVQPIRQVQPRGHRLPEGS